MAMVAKNLNKWLILIIPNEKLRIQGIGFRP